MALDDAPPVAGTPEKPRTGEARIGDVSWELTPDGREAVGTDASGARAGLVLDRAGRPVRRVGPDGATWRWTHDLCGRLTSATDPEHATTRLNRSAEGLLESVVLPSGATTRWVRDAEGRPVELVDPDGEVVRVEHDPALRVAAVGGPTDEEATVERDACGRVLARTHPDGLVERWHLDVAGRPVGLALTLDGETQHLTLARDACGRETSRVLPGGPVLTQEWDPDGWLMAQTLSRPDADATRSRLESRLAGLGATAPAAPVAPPEVLLGRRFLRSPGGRVSRVEGRDVELRPAAAPADGLTWIRHEDRPVAAAGDGLLVLSVLVGHDGRPEALLDPDGRVVALPPDLPDGPTAYAAPGVDGLAARLRTGLGLDRLHDAVAGTTRAHVDR